MLLRTSRSTWRVLLWIAWRQLVSRRIKHGLSFMTVISIAGVTVGVAALIIVLSVMGGFEAELKQKMLKGQPHLEIVGENALAGFPLKKHSLKSMKQLFPEATGIEAFTSADVVLKQGKHISPVELFGVDPQEKGHLWGFSDSMVEGKLEDIGSEHLPIVTAATDNSKWPGIVLGQSLAMHLGADVGDEIAVLSPSAATSATTALSGGTLTRHYVVVGIFSTGVTAYDSKWAVVSLDEGRKFMADYDESLDQDQYVTGVALNLKEPYDVDKLLPRFKNLPELQAKTWKNTNSALLFALKLEKFTMGSILMLIVLVAAFSISGTMMMTVFYRKRQICLLRSLGMTRSDIIKTYLSQGFTIGTVGILSGLFVGLAVCVFLELFRQGNIPANITALRSLPVKFLPFDYMVICGLAWFLSLGSTVYPALVASRQNPSSGLRV